MIKKSNFLHPAVFISTFFGAGLLKPASGTWGTLAAMPLAFYILKFHGQLAIFIASIVIYLIGVYSSHIFSKITNSHDASEIVIDEVAGVLLTLAFVPYSIESLIIGFLLFRLFDIFKPWPINFIDQKIDGGWGIMSDDMLAGIFAGSLLYLIVFLGWIDFVN